MVSVTLTILPITCANLTSSFENECLQTFCVGNISSYVYTPLPILFMDI